jgi:hypothetical protein
VSDRGLSIAADWQELDAGHSSPIRTIIPLGTGVEIGGLYDPFSDEVPVDNAWAANAKIRLGSLFGGESAIGGQFRREEDIAGLNTDFTQGYFAWTTDFNPGAHETSSLNLTWGANWTQIKPEVGDNLEAIRYFAGLRIRVVKSLSVIGEYQTRSRELGDTDAITALTARIGSESGIALEVGTTNAFGLRGTPDHNPFVGVNITFSTSGGRY